MTVAANYRDDYLGTGATADYDFTFEITAKAELSVRQRDIATGAETALVLDSDFTIPDADVNNADGGTITLAAGVLASGQRLSLRRVLPITQETDLRNQGAYQAEDVEDAFDRGVKIAQQHQDEIDRSLKLPESELPASTVVIPAKEARASSFLAFDAQGDPIAATAVTGTPVTAFGASLIDDVDAATARGTLRLTATGDALATALSAGAARTALGGVPRVVATVAALKALATTDLVGDVLVEGYGAAGDGGGGVFRWSSADVTADNAGTIIAPNAGGTGRWNRVGGYQTVVNARAFGATGDAATDDFAAILAAIKAIGAAGGGTLYLPAGTYRLSKAVPFINNLSIIGDGWATILKPLDSSVFGVIGEAYPSRFNETEGWTANPRFNQQYDADIADYQNTDGTVENVLVADLKIDGNKAAVVYNTFNAGDTDDAYQNAVRMDSVQKSTFRNLWIEGAVMNALSVYDVSNDCVFERIRITNTGKSTIPASGSYSMFGIYVEYTCARTVFRCIEIDTTEQYGISVKAATGEISDLIFQNITIKASGWDGIRIGDGADTIGTIDRVLVSDSLLVGCGTVPTYLGLRVQHDSTTVGRVSDCHLSNVVVSGCPNSHGIFIGGNAERTVVDACASRDNVGLGLAVGTGATDTLIQGARLYNNTAGTFTDTGTRTIYAGLQIAGDTEYAISKLRVDGDATIFTPAGTAARILWNQDTVATWESGITAGATSWYLYGYATNQILIDANGMTLNKPKIPVVLTVNLPAAGAAQDGRIVIEDAGAGDRNLIIYGGGQRFRIDGGAPF